MAAPDESAPDAEDVLVLAGVAGFPVDETEATRIAASIGPAMRVFRAVAGTLPFDLEPAAFVTVQNGAKP